MSMAHITDLFVPAFLASPLGLDADSELHAHQQAVLAAVLAIPPAQWAAMSDEVLPSPLPAHPSCLSSPPRHIVSQACTQLLMHRSSIEGR